MIDLIKPYPGEDEFTTWKRKVYFFREVKHRIDYQNKVIIDKIGNSLPLNPTEKEEIDTFWEKYLPGNIKESFLDYRFYEFYKTVKKDSEHLCDYMPDVFYEAFIDEYFTDPQHSRSFDDKNLYDIYFHDVQRPKTIFRKTRNIYLDESYSIISINDVIEKTYDESEVILKVSKNSCGGAGVRFWSKTGSSRQDLFDFLNSSTDIVCQKVLEQHAELKRLNPTSVNTIRVLTLVLEGEVHILSSVVRIGINGSRVDNASSGGIVCGIRTNGQLKGVAFDTSGKKFLRHPQGINFESVIIPNYSKLLDLSTSLAVRFTSISRLISWDFAVGETGQPILIEFNITHGQLDFHQMCNGPIFGDMTDAVLKEVFDNSYTLKSIMKSYGWHD